MNRVFEVGHFHHFSPNRMGRVRVTVGHTFSDEKSNTIQGIQIKQDIQYGISVYWSVY